MKEKNYTTESCDTVYRTGDTHPPKTRNGIIAFLLALVIFLCGISTALGLMNIHLFQKLSDLEATHPSPVAFSRGEHFRPSHDAVETPLGFAGQEVSDFWQTYHHLPKGIYVVEVTSDVHDLLPGDILTHIGDTQVTGVKKFNSVLKNYHPGDTIDVVLYRNGTNINTTLTMQED